VTDGFFNVYFHLPQKTVFFLVAGEVSVVFKEGNIDFYQEKPYN
jgi:hypothetical protein